MRILIIDEVRIKDTVSKLQKLYPKAGLQFFEEWDLGQRADQDAQTLITRVEDADPSILIISGSHVMGDADTAKSVFQKAPSLRYVIRAGVGTDHVNKPAATEAGVKVINEPFGNNEATAEWALRLMLAAQRQYVDLKEPPVDFSKEIFSVPTEEYQESHEYRIETRAHWGSLLEKLNQDMEHLLKPIALTQVERLRSQKIGILGMGNIGRVLARKLQLLNQQYQLEMKLLCYTKEQPAGQKDEDLKTHFLPSAKQLFQEADIISVHIPATEENTGFINAELLNGSSLHLFINTARDAIISHGDLLAHLQSFPDFRYYADFVAKDSAELNLFPRVVISDHIAGIPRSANEKVWRNVGKIIESIVAENAGKKNPNDYTVNVVNEPPSSGWRKI